MAKSSPQPELFDEGTAATASEPDSNGSAAGWEHTDTGGTAVCVSELGSFARHKWAGGETCERCHVAKPTAATREAKDSSGIARTRAPRTGELETAISLAWMGAGIGIEKQPWVGQVYMNRETGLYVSAKDAGENDRPVTVAEAVGKTIQMESAIAGKRIDRALRRTPLYKILAPYFSTVGLAADLAPLIAPPLLVGLAAARPDIGERFKPMMVMMLLPVLAEQAKMAESQNELIEKMEGVNQNTIDAASNLIDELLGTK